MTTRVMEEKARLEYMPLDEKAVTEPMKRQNQYFYEFADTAAS